MEFMPLIMFIAVCAVLMLGYPVAFTLSGVALIFALIGTMTCLLYTSPSPRDQRGSRMPSSA